MIKPDDLAPGVSATIKHHRRRLKINQVQLADRCGCTKALICRLEMKTARISLDMLFSLAAAFNLKPSALLAEFETKPRGSRKTKGK